MKKILLVTAVIWFASSCSGGNKITCSWHNSIKDKGSRLSFLFDEDSKLLYRISNDEELLYIDLIADQEELKKALLYSGLNIWFDSTAKAKNRQELQLISTQLPPQNSRPPKNGNPPNDRRQNNFEKRKDFDKMMSLETTGLPAELVEYHIHSDSLDGIRISIKIPYKYMTEKNHRPAVLSLILESREMPNANGRGDRPGGGQGMRPVGQMKGEGQGAHPGGQGMQGGKPGTGGEPPLRNQYQGFKIKIKKLQLATYDNS